MLETTQEESYEEDEVEEKIEVPVVMEGGYRARNKIIWDVAREYHTYWDTKEEKWKVDEDSARKTAKLMTYLLRHDITLEVRRELVKNYLEKTTYIR